MRFVAKGVAHVTLARADILQDRRFTLFEKLIAAVALLEGRIEEPFDLNARAGQLNLSCRQIGRLFNRYLGVTPVRHMNDLRLQRDRALLSETDKGVTEVAIACGYARTSHFPKSFGSNTHYSPINSGILTSRGGAA